MNDADLIRIERVVDATGLAERVEALLPIGVRARQLSVRTLFIALLLTLSDHRPAHLARVHRALMNLSTPKQWRLGVLANWRGRPHLLTYRQVEYTFSLVTSALEARSEAEPSPLWCSLVDAFLDASIEPAHQSSSSSLAIDWTDVESFASPVSAAQRLAGHEDCADSEASWGHRNSGGRGAKNELFFGYYLSLATMVKDEGGPAVPELVRRMNLTTCSTDPVRAFVPVLERLVTSGMKLGDVLADAGYSNRLAKSWALPLRALGADIVTDLHPHDRGRQGTFAGATCFNGTLYCPGTPENLFDLQPLPRGASSSEIDEHDLRSTELSRYKLARISVNDSDGYHRVACPGAVGKIRCPLRLSSMTLNFTHPEVLAPPEHPPLCCEQRTLTVPPSVNAKTAQKHDYPSRAHRLSYARRTGVERSNARFKDSATIDISRGWCRVMGVTPMSLFLVCALVVRNLAVADSFAKRQADDAARITAGRPPKTRRRRRKTLNDLVGVNAAPNPTRLSAIA